MSWGRDCVACKPKMFTISPFQKNLQIQEPTKHMKRCRRLLAKRNMQTEPIVNYLVHLLEWLKFQRLTSVTMVGQLGLSDICG